MSGQTGVTPMPPTGKHSVSLTERQVETILTALKYDYITTKRDFGALPIAVEMCDEIEDAYRAVRTQAR